MLWLAAASTLCLSDPTNMGNWLMTTKNEVFFAAGRSEDGGVTLFFTAGDNGTWTIVKTNEDGKYCIAESGTVFRFSNAE